MKITFQSYVYSISIRHYFKSKTTIHATPNFPYLHEWYALNMSKLKILSMFCYDTMLWTTWLIGLLIVDKQLSLTDISNDTSKNISNYPTKKI